VIVEIDVQHELLRGARLHPRRAGDDLGADVDLDRDVGDGASSDPRAQHDGNVAAPRPSLLRARRACRASAARADAEHDVVARSPTSSCASSRVVLLGVVLGVTRTIRSVENVGPHSAASAAAMRPDVPAPT
jgi:hypothetical protein